MADKTFLCIVTFSSILQICLGNPIEAFDLKDEYLATKASDIGFRLPMHFMPDTYLIRVSDIDFEEAIFKGITEITFQALTTTNELKLHAVNLEGTTNQDSVVITKYGTLERLTIASIEPNSSYEMFTIRVITGFQEGERYLITFLEYIGSMDYNNVGFYRSFYNQNGNKEWLGTTQMQTTDARKVFPCFDEPSYKANFSVSIQRPIVDGEEYGPSFSNMVGSSLRDPENRMWDNFMATPKMSTYLVAFVVSKFSVFDTVQEDNKIFRILARPEAENQTEFAFVEGLKMVDAMNKFINMDYFAMGNIKMDHAAVPDVWVAAMENWGLITYREAFLLAQDDETSVRHKQLILTIMAHEIGHLWFGNYVTCHWWSDAWLNEGFASLIEFRLPDLANLDFKTSIQFPVVVVQRALLSDTPTRSSPLSNVNVNSPDEIKAHFGVISYSKGGSVIRMVEHWIGQSQFNEVLNYYITQNAYGATTPDDVYNVFQEFASEGQNITEMMSTWVVASGYPLITATIDYEAKTMTITQKRFTKAWEEDVDYLFQVPISYATKSSPNFEDTKPDHLLKEESEVISDISLEGHEWIVLNKQQTGYYRVNYDEHTWDILGNALRSTERTSIHEINRAQIVDDLFNLAREDVITYTRALDVLDFLREEDEYGPWTSAYVGFSFVRQQLSMDRNLLSKFDNHIKNLLEMVVDKLLDYSEDNSFIQLFRINTLNFACLVGVEKCLANAENHFKDYIESNSPVPPNNREYVYCNGLRYGEPEYFDALWEAYLTDNVANDKVVILGALGCTKDKDKITQLLNELAKVGNSEIRNHDELATINSILNGNLENAEVVLQYLENDFLKLRNRLGSYSTLFTNLGSRLTEHQISRFHQLVLDNVGTLSNSEILAGMTAFADLALQGTYMRKAGLEIDDWLSEKYSGAGA